MNTTRRRYSDISEWITDCQKIVHRDLDNLILFTGDEGVGKSTIQFQVMKAIDPEFSAADICFSIEEFLERAPHHPKYRAITMDEALLNHRKGMHGITIALMDYFQRCRGLNHHIGFCFPHPEMLDKAVLDHRVRWNIHVPKRGVFILRVRIELPPTKPGGLPIFTWSRPLGKWRFRENTGHLWQEYLKLKEAHMRNMGNASDIVDDLPPKLVADLVSLRKELEKTGRGGARINHVP